MNPATHTHTHIYIYIVKMKVQYSLTTSVHYESTHIIKLNTLITYVENHNHAC
ncbi:hypothetical protein HanRHA438_Chr01g0043951 [Helianthus annuus]|nr:hypothetical protein HanRHA438_Chr01g0043951 [Helianthus annuus]